MRFNSHHTQWVMFNLPFKTAPAGYGRRSTIIGSQIPVDKWHDLIGDLKASGATRSRLTWGLQVLPLFGASPSFRIGAVRFVGYQHLVPSWPGALNVHAGRPSG
jgi:hypothetical protein